MPLHFEGKVELPHEHEERVRAINKEKEFEFLKELHLEKEIEEKILRGEYSMSIDAHDRSITVYDKEKNIVQYNNFSTMTPEEAKKLKYDSKMMEILESYFNSGKEERPS